MNTYNNFSVSQLGQRIGVQYSGQKFSKMDCCAFFKEVVGRSLLKGNRSNEKSWTIYRQRSHRISCEHWENHGRLKQFVMRGYYITTTLCVNLYSPNFVCGLYLHAFIFIENFIFVVYRLPVKWCRSTWDLAGLGNKNNRYFCFYLITLIIL